MVRSALTIILFVPALSFAQHYKCTEANGKTAFQDTPCAATAQTKIIPTQESKELSDPIKAATTLGNSAYTIMRMEGWCEGYYNAAHASIVEARTKWQARHEKLLAKGKQILAEKFTDDERRTLSVAISRETDSVIAALERGDIAAYKKMCTELPQKIASPEINPVGNLVLVAAINNYKLAAAPKTK